MLNKHTRTQTTMSENFRIHADWSWAYPHALEWMSSAKALLLKTGQMSIGVGSHHHDLITLGRHASEEDIVDLKRLQNLNIPIYRVDRGGKATIHGPGQIVVYPIVSLSQLQLTVPEFTSACENAMIECLHEFNIRGHTKEKQPGVFVDDSKIGAIGFHVSQSCVTHGISLNVSNNLSLYNAIAPCGIPNAYTCSLTSISTQANDIQHVAKTLLNRLISALTENKNTAFSHRRHSLA